MRAPASVATLLYHEVSDVPARSGFQRPGARPFRVPVLPFIRHLGALARAGSPELVSAIRPEVPGRHLLLAFDDGGRSALDVAALLEVRGWKAHFFIVTSLIGRPGFLAAGDIRALREAGHLVGSHSHTHPDIFRDLSPARMRDEWRISADILAQLLGEPCRAGSVPGGDISAVALASAADAGLQWLFTSEPWLHPLRVGPCWVFGRFCVKGTTPLETVGALAGHAGWSRALFERRMRGLAARGLGGFYRWYVARSTRPDTAGVQQTVTS